MASPPDFYRVLGVSKDSSAEEIRKAYKLLARKWHPDKHPASSKQEAEARFKAAAQAYEALNDHEYRSRLRVGSSIDAPCPGIDQNGQRVERKPPPVERELECTLEELCWGCKKEVKLSRNIVATSGLVMQKPESCTVAIKPGWKKGTRITFEGAGNDADLVFLISEKKHRSFKRVGDDLIMKVEVPLVKALVGWTFSFSLLGGKKMSCSFRDEIIFPGYQKVVKAQGMPRCKGDGERGDLIIKFHIVFPRRLSKEQKLGLAELLRENN